MLRDFFVTLFLLSSTALAASSSPDFTAKTSFDGAGCEGQILSNESPNRIPDISFPSFVSQHAVSRYARDAVTPWTICTASIKMNSEDGWQFRPTTSRMNGTVSLDGGVNATVWMDHSYRDDISSMSGNLKGTAVKNYIAGPHDVNEESSGWFSYNNKHIEYWSPCRKEVDLVIAMKIRLDGVGNAKLVVSSLEQLELEWRKCDPFRKNKSDLRRRALKV